MQKSNYILRNDECKAMNYGIISLIWLTPIEWLADDASYCSDVHKEANHEDIKEEQKTVEEAEDTVKKLDNSQVAITKGRLPSTGLRTAWEKAIRSKSKKTFSNPKRGI